MDESPTRTLTVDGTTFAIAGLAEGGESATLLTGPHAGHGVALGTTTGEPLSDDEWRTALRAWCAQLAADERDGVI